MVIKDFYKILFSILSVIIAFFVTIYSHNDGNVLLFALIPILITGIIISLNVGIFKYGNFKSNFLESLKYSFLISSLIYISGYLFFSLEHLFI